MMVSKFLADLTLLLHFTFIIFVISGGFLAIRWSWLPWVHIPAVTWTVLLEWRGWVCPLTHLENFLREAGGEEGYESDFIQHYLAPIIYPAGLTSEIQIFLGLGVLLINGVAYCLLWQIRLRRQ